MTALVQAKLVRMRYVESRSASIVERCEGATHDDKRFRCCHSGKQFNERSSAQLNQAQHLSNVVPFVRLWLLRYNFSLRDLAEMFAQRGKVCSNEASQALEAKLTPSPVAAKALRFRRCGKVGRSWYVDENNLVVGGRWCYRHRAIDQAGALTYILFSEWRDTKAILRSGETITGIMHDGVTTDGYNSYPARSGLC